MSTVKSEKIGKYGTIVTNMVFMQIMKILIRGDFLAEGGGSRFTFGGAGDCAGK